MLAVDPGFDTQRVVRGRVSLRGIYRRDETAALRRRIVSALLEIPGVEHVAWAHFESFVLDHRRHPFYLRARPRNAGAGDVMLRQVVSPGYFETMGIPLLAGRLPTGPGQGWVVDSTFQNRYFPGGTAVGAELFYQPQGPDQGGPWPRVVGVVGRANFEGLARRDGPPVVYDVGGDDNYHTWDFTILLRTSRAGPGIVRDLRSKLKEVDPSLPLSRVGTLEDALEALHMDRRGAAVLTSVFAGLALLLAAIGVFAVLSYAVEQRTQEIGVRVALGGSALQILSLVLRQGFMRAAVGMAVGAVSAYSFAGALQNQLFDVSARDSATYCAAAGLLLLAIAIAGYVPARGALRVDPVESLRGE